MSGASPEELAGNAGQEVQIAKGPRSPRAHLPVKLELDAPGPTGVDQICRARAVYLCDERWGVAVQKGLDLRQGVQEVPGKLRRRGVSANEDEERRSGTANRFALEWPPQDLLIVAENDPSSPCHLREPIHVRGVGPEVVIVGFDP